MPTWPASLPQSLRLSGLSETDSKAVVRTEMTAGPAFQRNRFSAITQDITGSLSMTEAQVGTFLDFYRNTLGNGAAEFDWMHPRTDAPVTMRFVGNSPPSINAVGGGRYTVSVSIEVLP